MKMSRSAGEQRMAVSRSRPARRREGAASRGFAMALWATKMRAAPHRPVLHCAGCGARPHASAARPSPMGCPHFLAVWPACSAQELLIVLCARGWCYPNFHGGKRCAARIYHV